jgi:hypothetical protein
MFKNLYKWAKDIVSKYPVVVAGVVIYLYYLGTTVDFLGHATGKKTFWEYIIQFDSLIFLWIASAALIQLQSARKEKRLEEENRRSMERLIDRQEIYSGLLKDIMMLLQDNVNNPLAIISTTTQEIRRKFNNDAEIMRWLDRIEGAMTRIHHTIRDLEAYEARKLLDASTETLREARAAK